MGLENSFVENPAQANTVQNRQWASQSPRDILVSCFGIRLFASVPTYPRAQRGLVALAVQIGPENFRRIGVVGEGIVHCEIRYQEVERRGVWRLLRDWMKME